MAAKSRILLNVAIAICVALILIFDHWLSKVGEGFQLFKPELPPGITINYESLQGYKFLEEGFMHIVDEHTVFENDTVNTILAYDGTDYNVLIKCKTARNENLYLNIQVVESAQNEIKYALRRYESKGDEDWVDLSDKHRIRSVITWRNVLIVLLLILFVVKLFTVLRRVKRQ